MKRGAAFLVFAGIFLLFTLNTVFAQQTIQVRLASPLPRNSDWGRTLDRMAAEWASVTNNQVRLRIIHDGIEGSESKSFSSLATNNIQASLFTSFGLSLICPQIMTLSVPFMIRDDAELDAVLKDVLPEMEKKVNADYVVIAWSRAGWANVFSKDAVFEPSDLRKHKLATSPETKELNTAFKTMGFNLVETGLTDVGPRLANNMINAIYQTPASVAPLRLYKTLGNMLDLPIAPIIGGIVVNRVTWNKLSANHQREILRVTRKIVEEFDAAMPVIVANAVSMMQRDGLKLNKPDSRQEALWYAEVQRVLPALLGTTFDREIYQRINDRLEKTRNRQ
jgi:TRAP-type C4-dicarboxylate transport system substrate-binding protein